MRSTSCQVHFSPHPEPVVHISNSLLRTLKLLGRKKINVKLGKASITAAIKPIRREGKHLYLSSGLRNSFPIPKANTSALLRADDDELQLGPLIGILTDFDPAKSSNPFAGRGYIRQIMRIGEKKAYFFAFTPRDIQWQQRKVNGYFLNAQGSYYRQLVPLPDVVYNRLPNRQAESQQPLITLREKFVRQRIPFFNWSFFDKSDVYNLLDQDADAMQHLPESVPHPKPEKMKAMLEKYQFVYYKPSGGSLGNGIYRLTYHPERGYFARYRNKGSNVLLRFTHFSSLMKMLQTRHGNNLSNYVCQQGIRLIEIDNCPIDFRFHMHKNGQNDWVPVGIGAKKAGRGSVTTHIKNGGQLLTPEHALSHTFGSRADDILEKAKKISIRLCNAIERNYEHQLGELGLDIGIDKDGDIWMFEANAKPGRSIFAHPDLKAQGTASLSHIVEHCLFLARFRGRD